MRMDFSFLSKSSIEDLEDLSMMVHNAPLLKLIQVVLLIKKNNYHTLSDEELQKENEAVYEEGRYLRRTETNFDWQNQDPPEGLLNAIQENEDLQKAIEFEQERRVLEKSLQ